MTIISLIINLNKKKLQLLSGRRERAGRRKRIDWWKRSAVEAENPETSAVEVKEGERRENKITKKLQMSYHLGSSRRDRINPWTKNYVIIDFGSDVRDDSDYVVVDRDYVVVDRGIRGIARGRGKRAERGVQGGRTTSSWSCAMRRRISWWRRSGDPETSVAIEADRLAVETGHPEMIAAVEAEIRRARRRARGGRRSRGIEGSVLDIGVGVDVVAELGGGEDGGGKGRRDEEENDW
ncbi:Uncharacterized protein Rs2_30934 [Raphanus sativus]|nr:Uncharacterized protein Rs2_30934 [Raphanus sativus]